MILHYLNELRRELGGVVQSVVTICDSLSESGQSVRLVSQLPRDVPEKWAGLAGAPIVESINRPGILGKLDNESREKFRQWIAQCDIVHLHTPWDMANMGIAKLAREQNKSVLLSLHGMLDQWSLEQKAFKKSMFLKLIGRRFLRSVDYLHCTAQSEKEQALQVLGDDLKERIFVVPLIVDLEQAEQQDVSGTAEHDTENPAILLFLGRVHPQKGVHLLVEAARFIDQTKHPFKIVIAGPVEPGYQNELTQLAKSLDLESNIEFAGPVYGPQKKDIYCQASITVLPTYQESFGLVSVESMAYGTPVITTKESDIWQELQEAQGIIVGHQPEEIATEITRLLDDPQRAREIGKFGQQYVLNWLDRDKVIDQYRQTYQQVVDGK